MADLPDLTNMTFAERLQLLQVLRDEMGGGSRFDNDDFMEVSIAWAKGEITSTVVREMVGNNNYSQAVGIGLRRAIRIGRLVEAAVPKKKR